jgi:hypothetical protein
MTYEKAANALVDAGLLDQADVGKAIAALGSPSVEMTYPGWAEALVQAGLLAEANLAAAIAVMEKAGSAEAEDDSPGFEGGLENAGIL